MDPGSAAHRGACARAARSADPSALRSIRGTRLQSHRSKRTLTQPRHIRRPRARRGPTKAAVLFRDRNIVDAGFAAAHQAGFIELPLLVAIGTVPLPRIVVPFVLKAHRDTVAV